MTAARRRARGDREPALEIHLLDGSRQVFGDAGEVPEPGLDAMEISFIARPELDHLFDDLFPMFCKQCQLYAQGKDLKEAIKAFCGTCKDVAARRVGHE